MLSSGEMLLGRGITQAAGVSMARWTDAPSRLGVSRLMAARKRRPAASSLDLVAPEHELVGRHGFLHPPLGADRPVLRRSS
jgi:hypothetical protein